MKTILTLGIRELDFFIVLVISTLIKIFHLNKFQDFDLDKFYFLTKISIVLFLLLFIFIFYKKVFAISRDISSIALNNKGEVFFALSSLTIVVFIIFIFFLSIFGKNFRVFKILKKWQFRFFRSNIFNFRVFIKLSKILFFLVIVLIDQFLQNNF